MIVELEVRQLDRYLEMIAPGQKIEQTPGF